MKPNKQEITGLAKYLQDQIDYSEAVNSLYLENLPLAIATAILELLKGCDEEREKNFAVWALPESVKAANRSQFNTTYKYDHTSYEHGFMEGVTKLLEKIGSVPATTQAPTTGEQDNIELNKLKDQYSGARKYIAIMKAENEWLNQVVIPELKKQIEDLQPQPQQVTDEEASIEDILQHTADKFGYETFLDGLLERSKSSSRLPMMELVFDALRSRMK